MTLTEEKKEKKIETLEEATIRFAGDSGDGMQLTGGQFTNATAIVGNDLSTLPDFPAEIRAPAGSLAGVSAFQIHFSSKEIHTPGDILDVLVAMNPAALKTSLKDLKPGGMLIVNTDAFTETNLKKAGYEENPLEAEINQKYQVFPIEISRLTQLALEDMNLPGKVVDRSKNLFALGLMYWLYTRPMDTTIDWLKKKFSKDPVILEANLKVLKAGYHYGETTETFISNYEIKHAKLLPGKYRNITGNEATVLGLVAAHELTGLTMFLGSYPITPASDILHELSKYKNLGIRTFQAEDEIAAIGAAIGASFAGGLGVTTTSGPGICLKSEFTGLAIKTELPLIICDIQRGGPSTGLPTKTEQGDLLQVMFGRTSESPIPILAAATPGDCFETMIEAVRIAVKYMTPVFFMSDGYLANGSEPWRIPQINTLPKIEVKFRKEADGFYPYLRNPDTLARPWALPGTPGLEHVITGVETEQITGKICYDPQNHDAMIKIRAKRIAQIENDIPDIKTIFGESKGDLLILGWGSTLGSINAACEQLLKQGYKVANAHLRYLNPFPKNLGEFLKNYKKILIPEINLGQLRLLIRAKYLIDAQGFNIVGGQPLKVNGIVEAATKLLKA
ncbi:MAG: 2-oxoglutarate ferredoxin oxidoreductase subunit alpha [Candidatus Melainabacteria bacterium RIFCSPLOWO2_02_FULL_35_15]|nr:MAG: 2-oxoglutarate ferredoxin oxidoreductase subunit alpha [Candidatus Melainabacteria bacterium RIFCSPLOWO2_12_FULL_35_11]OGI13275.1 MAG: 2-oxoglutarate ferredoxin oxidoreductase subunit alpha [Candidatus Melainabacteria bacterium RIFCSPLOWO2_02_FULL_35_15]